MLAVNGNDLVALGYNPGTILGDTLNALLQKVLEQPSLNDKNTLLTLAKDMKP